MKLLNLLFVLLAAFAVGCGSDDNSNPSPKDGESRGEKVNDDPFQKQKWYSYQFQTHLIWTNFDVYMVEHNSQFYKVQILSYYDLETLKKPGYYTIRVEQKNGDLSEITFDGGGCSHPQQNPDYDKCIKDPQQNAYTYVNLNTLTAEKMSDDKAVGNTDWSIAFKSLDIKLNTAADVSGELLYRDPKVIKNGRPDFVYLQKKIQADFDIATFVNTKFPESALFEVAQ